MSLLGANVFANPTTPIWGQGGGGTTIPVGGELTFLGSPNMALGLTGDKITALDASANYAPFQASEFRAFDGVGSYVAIGTDAPNPIGLRAYLDDGTLQNTFATFVSSGWNLSNVVSINGSPYAPTLTSFDFSNQAGASLAEAPDFTILNAVSFTAPDDGKLYMEAMGNFVATTQFGGAGIGFAVNGSTISNSLSLVNAYNSNINLPAVSMWQIPVTSGQVYDISSIAQCSALPPAGPDMVVQTSRLLTMFTPN